MADSPSRYTAFVREILTADEPRDPDREHLESLLHWLAGRGTPQAKAIQAAFDHHQASSNAAQRHTLNYLDRVLFAHDADPYRLFGLIPGCDFADIRARHKQLLQVFHPDRHQQHKDWFTRRSERLNHAYAHLKQNHTKQSTTRQTTPNAATTPAHQTGRPEPRTPNPKPRPSTPQPRTPSASDIRSRLKEHLGNPAKLQQRAFIVLFTVPAVLLLVLYVNNQGDVVGDSVVTVAKNDPTPRTPEANVSITPRDPAHLAGTPIDTAPAATLAGAADTEPRVDAPTIEPEPLRIASRSLDGPHNGDRDSNVTTDNPAPDDDPQVTKATADSRAEADNASPQATPTDSPLASENASEPANEESRADNTETASKQLQSQPANELQTAAPNTAGTTAKNDKTQPDQEINAEQTSDQEARTDNTQTAALDTANTTVTTDTTEPDQEIEAGQTIEPEARADNPQTTSSAASRADNSETATKQSQGQPENALQTAARDTANTTATTDTTEPDQEIQVGQTSGPETSGDDPESASATDPPAEETDATPEDETNNAQETEQTASAPTTNHQSQITSHQSSQITNHRNSAQAVAALLQAYAAAYNTSNINQFGALFQQNAETKYASGRREIKKKYGEFFQNTSKRNVAFKDVRIELLGDRQFKVTAQYQADWTYPNGRSKTNTGQFQLHLTPEEDQLKIWKLNY